MNCVSLSPFCSCRGLARRPSRCAMLWLHEGKVLRTSVDRPISQTPMLPRFGSRLVCSDLMPRSTNANASSAVAPVTKP